MVIGRYLIVIVAVALRVYPNAWRYAGRTTIYLIGRIAHPPALTVERIN